MSEPGEPLDVVDAFDTEVGDPFDLWLSLGFHQSWETGRIRRESNLGPDGTASKAGFVTGVEDIASYEHNISTLEVRADVGLWQDIGIFFRLPIILADTRSLSGVAGSDALVNKVNGIAADPATGDPYFKLPFHSPTRSGVDYLAVGLRWSIFNQFRDSTKPTWTWEIEGRFAVGDPMRACNADPVAVPAGAGGKTGQTYPSCPSNDAVYRSNGVDVTSGGRWYHDPASPGQSAGISRGTNAIRISTMVSNRYRYVEPYGGFWFLAEFQNGTTAIGDYSDLQGIISNRPPLQGGLLGGVMIHPWENREQFQRFTIDVRVHGKYVSPGRDYSPLFDALGSSNAAGLVAPNPSSYRPSSDGTASVGNYDRVVNFTGVTDNEAYGAFGAQIGFVLAAAEYVRLGVGVGLTNVQGHALTAADACNPNFAPLPGSAGRCSATASGQGAGTPNPNHRPGLDLPGRRFLVAETFLWDAWLKGTLMF